MPEPAVLIPGVSVLICCYNSARRLPETLRHLAQQQVDNDIDWEVIVIDNASTDDTAAIATAEWEKYDVQHVGFTVVKEVNPGKNHALKKGISSAKYTYIITCDDDNWLAPNYVSVAFAQMQADDQLGALGGCGIFEPEQPMVVEIAGFESGYINGAQAWAESEHWVYGAGCVYRKGPLMPLVNDNWPLVSTGRVGDKLNGGEDAEICFMLYLSGYKIAYCSDLSFKHFVPRSRQRLNYLIGLAFWQSYSNVLLNSYYSIFNNTANIKTMLNKWFFFSARSMVKITLKRAFDKFSPRNRFSLQQQIAYNSQCGTFVALLKSRRQVYEHHEHIKRILADMKAEKHKVTA